MNVKALKRILLDVPDDYELVISSFGSSFIKIKDIEIVQILDKEYFTQKEYEDYDLYRPSNKPNAVRFVKEK